RLHSVEQAVPALQFDQMALAVIETKGLDPGKTLQRPCKAGRGILSAGEQHQRGLDLNGRAHATALNINGRGGQLAGCPVAYRCVLRHIRRKPNLGVPCPLTAISRRCSTSWPGCARPAAAARGTSSRILRP